MLTDLKPLARAARMMPRVSSSLWMRFTARCTSASKSCTPMLMRLKPSLPSSAMVASLTLRGSISIEYSPSSTSLKCWRTAAEVQLLDHLSRPEQFRLHRHFLDQVAHIFGGLAAILGDDLVAGAVEAQRITERDVDIQLQRAGDAANLAFCHPLAVTL